MEVESLIFDIDGTLWDSRALVAEGYNIQLKEEGLDHLCVTVEDLKALFGKTMSDIADVILASIPEDKRYDLMERCMDTEQRHLAQDPCHIGYPRVKETLEALSARYRLFIVSNSQKGYPALCMEKMGISHLFEGHMCFGDTGTHKGETILRLMERHNIQSAVYIGDTLGDQTAADHAGLPFIWCSFGFGVPEHYAGRVDSFEALLTLF